MTRSKEIKITTPSSEWRFGPGYFQGLGVRDLLIVDELLLIIIIFIQLHPLNDSPKRRRGSASIPKTDLDGGLGLVKYGNPILFRLSFILAPHFFHEFI